MNFKRFTTSSNPFLNDSRMERTASSTHQGEGFNFVDSSFMTVNGAVNKSFILAGLLVLTAFFAAYSMNPILMWVGLGGGIISFFVAFFRPKTAPVSAPLYTIFEGLFLGTISAVYASVFGSGVVVNSVLLTILALVTMLALYRSGIIRPTKRFYAIVTTATAAIAVTYLVNIGLHAFGFSGVPYLHTMTPMGIIISLVIIAVACLNLIIDFHQFERGEALELPKHYEWLSAMGLIVTLVWLYLEILRLVAMFSGED
jgi:uncharacterized YccA/Bax inhibitor family protein